MERTDIYTALSSNDVCSLKVILQKASEVSQDTEHIRYMLAEIYEEIKTKNIPLNEEIDFLVTYTLVDTDFFSPNSSETLQEIKLTVENVVIRIKIIRECALFLINNYLDKNMDDNFAQRIRIITQHTNVLKKYLRSTYQKLPWEEMEFFLLMLLLFISAPNNEVHYYKLVLDRNRVLNYLEMFTKKLDEIGSNLQKNDINPKVHLQSRETLMKAVVTSDPMFKSLYQDYEIVRDIYSLNRIDYYLKHSLNFSTVEDLELRKQIIQRTLQVIGEYLKNTTESPNVSNHVHKVLIASAPNDLKDIVTSLRDSLSHAHSLVQRFQIEKTQDDFFNRLLDNLRKIQTEINVIINKRKTHALIAFCNKIKHCYTVEEVKYLLAEIVLNDSIFIKLDCKDFMEEEVKKIKELIDRLSDLIPDKTWEETHYFNMIEDYLGRQSMKVDTFEKSHKHLKSLFGKTIYDMKRSNNLEYIKKIFINVSNQIIHISETVPFNYFSQIAYYVNEIQRSLLSRNHNHIDIKEADDLINHTLLTLDIESNSIKKIKEFETDLVYEDDIEPGNSKQVDDVIESVTDLIVSDDLIAKINQGYENKKQVSKIKSKMLFMLAKLEQEESYVITNDDRQQWQGLLNLLDIKRQTKDTLILSFESKDLKSCKERISKLDDSYSTLLNNFSDHRNLFINKKQQLALRSFLTSLKLKNDVENIMKKFIDNLQANIKTFFTERFNILRNLLTCDDEENKEKIILKYMQEQSFQIIIEALMLDLLEILEDMSFFTDNRLFIDHYTPVLIGKSLRNYLAHGNLYLDQLPIKSSISILCNALKLVKCSENLVDMRNSLIGKIHICESDSLQDRNFNSLKYINIQSKMFINATRNDVERIKECISEGADIFARSLDGRNALHYSAETDSIDAFKFFVSQGLNLHWKSSSGLQPSHIAAIHGSNKIIHYYLENNLPESVLGNGDTIAHLAAKHGHLQIIRELLERNYDITVKNVHDVTPLHLSSEYGHIDIVKLLLSKSPSIDDETKCLCTALHYASRNGHKEIVELLLGYEVSKELINKPSLNGSTPLHFAARNGHIDVVKILLNAKAALLPNHMKYTPLCVCVLYGHFDIFKLLYYSVDNEQQIDKKKLLQLACHNGYPSIISFLLESGEDPDQPLRSDLRYLHEAVYHGQEDAVKVLLAAGAEANAADDRKLTPLHLACQNGYVNIVNDLLNAKADINCLDETGMTPLCMAASFGNLEIFNILITKGADINLTDVRKITPLHAAIEVRNYEMVNNLLQLGAIPNVGTDRGITPLHLACSYGLIDIVCALLNTGADVNALAENNYTPLHIACREGYKTLVEKLLENNAHVNAQTVRKTQSEMTKVNHKVIFSHLWSNAGALLNVEGLTPLHFAAQNGSYDIIILLLSRGAELEISDENKATPLILAAQNGHTKILNLLISKGANFDIVIKDNLTPLMIAVFGDNKKTVEALLRAGASINLANKDGYTALHFAALHNSNNILRILLDYGADRNCFSVHDLTALHLAAMKGNKDGVGILIEKGADVNANKAGITPLEFAIYSGQREIVQLLCESGAEINPLITTKTIPLVGHIQDKMKEEVREVLEALDEESSTPLLSAVYHDVYEIVCDLLSYGADPNIPSYTGKYPLHVASLKGQTNSVRKLLEFRADIEKRTVEQFTPLFCAIQGNHVDTVRVLLVAGARVDVKNLEGATLLTMAVVRGSEEIIKELLNHGANIDERFNDTTPLYLACKHGYVEKVKVLLEHGANVDIVTKQLWSPLHVAASGDNLEIVSLLLDHGASLNSTSIEGIRPLHLAAQNGRLSIVQLLLHRGDDVDVTILDDNSTPLYLASFYGHSELVEILLDAGADLHIPTKEGLTPLHAAIMRNHPSIVRKLLRAKADPNIETSFIFKPLHVAIVKYYVEMICDLLVHGADIDEQSEFLMTQEKIKRGIWV